MVKCPESIEELEELERLLPLCKQNLYETAQSKIATGAAHSRREAERQIAEETGRPLGTVRRGIWEVEKQNRVAQDEPHCEKGLQAKETDEEAQPQQPLCLLHTGDQESYTPEKYIESARRVMGSIDLDPASNEMAQKTVKATTYYAKEDNGLDKSWKGNIFLNPPYSHPEIKYFVDKLLTELKPGQQAILLTNNNTDTNFFHDAARKASALCFTKGRINFIKPDGSTSSPTNGQTFFYFGDNKAGFINEFSQYGLIMELSAVELS